MPSRLRVVAACLAAGVALAAAPPAWSDSPHRLQQRSQHAAARAHRLDQQAQQQAGRLAASRAQLQRLDARANAALAGLQKARLAADRATAAADAERARLAAAEKRTEAARAALDDMAANAYRTLSTGGSMASALSLIDTGNPQAFLDGLAMLGQVGQHEAAVVDEFRVAQAAQHRQEALAAAAEQRAVDSRDQAAAAKAQADRLVARQQQAVRERQQLLARTRSAASAAHALTSRLQHQLAVARARAAAIRAAQARRAAIGNLPVPRCNGGSVAGYPNGQLPVSALCPLWGAPGMMLQHAAAQAFNRMSQAYAHAFGSPICVTSSYRTYAKQVYLYRTMPRGYAAVPGTSNHGYGLAVDLCGGVQVDGSPEHEWLMSHAAAFSWFHPAWALPGGPGPHEPWHWEYAG